MSELVLVELREQTAIVTINRADKRNALSRSLITALHEAVERVADDAKVRAVILTGAGPVFCAGMDLAELQGSLDAGAEESPVWDDALRLARLYDRLYSLAKPTIDAGLECRMVNPVKASTPCSR